MTTDNDGASQRSATPVAVSSPLIISVQRRPIRSAKAPDGTSSRTGARWNADSANPISARL